MAGPTPPQTGAFNNNLPRVTIEFCTQCKWMLRAAYFAQELLSTFSTSLGEVALQPSTGGTFIVHLYTADPSTSEDQDVSIQQHLLWDRKAEGGFPETKELKRRVRDIIDPKRDLGHVDGNRKIPQSQTGEQSQAPPIPRAVNRLQELSPAISERKFTPMDVDVSSRPASSKGDGGEGGTEVLNARGKVQVDGGGAGFCRPGEDCEDCG